MPYWQRSGSAWDAQRRSKVQRFILHCPVQGWQHTKHTTQKKSTNTLENNPDAVEEYVVYKNNQDSRRRLHGRVLAFAIGFVLHTVNQWDTLESREICTHDLSLKIMYVSENRAFVLKKLFFLKGKCYLSNP